MIITKRSQSTGKISSMDILLTPAEHNEIIYRTRNIQEIVPHLSPDEREFLMTGTTAEEWKQMFGSRELINE